MEVVRTHARRWAFRVSLGLATLMLGPKCVTVAWAGSAPSVTPSPAVKLKTLSVTDWVGDRVLTEPVLDSLLDNLRAAPYTALLSLAMTYSRTRVPARPRTCSYEHEHEHDFNRSHEWTERFLT